MIASGLRRLVPMALPLLLVTGLAAVLSNPAAAGQARRSDQQVCLGGRVRTGVYRQLLVAGACDAHGATIRVLGNLTVGGNAAFTDTSGHLEVDGNIIVAPDSSLDLSCSHAGADCLHLLVHGSLTTSRGPWPHPPGIRPKSTQYTLRVVNNSGRFEDFSVYQVDVDLAVAGDGFEADASGGFQSVTLTGLQVARNIVVEGADGLVAIAGDNVGGNVVLDDNHTLGRRSYDVADDRINGSLSCSSDVPPPYDGGEPDHARDGLHGECRRL
jgi:hypothetical protein